MLEVLSVEFGRWALGKGFDGVVRKLRDRGARKRFVEAVSGALASNESLRNRCTDTPTLSDSYVKRLTSTGVLRLWLSADAAALGDALMAEDALRLPGYTGTVGELREPILSACQAGLASVYELVQKDPVLRMEFDTHFKQQTARSLAAIREASERAAHGTQELLRRTEIRPYYFRNGNEVLRTGVIPPLHDEWFPKSGPIAWHFEHDHVYRRPNEVNRLRELLEEHRFVVLDGAKATGKSVLVRDLAYETLSNGSPAPLQMWDCKLRRADSEDSRRVLIEEAQHQDELLIVENAHLDPQTVDLLYHDLRYTWSGKLLIVPRSSIWDALERRTGILLELKESGARMQLEPFAAFDGIVHLFGRQQSAVPMDIDALRDCTRHDYWLLSYALRGWVITKGKGDSVDWVRRGVTADLHELETRNCAYPEALVALAFLYRDEVTTAGCYMVDRLGFEARILNDLIEMGEIICAEEGHERYYGLPHSALADAYWRHGQHYWRTRARRAELPLESVDGDTAELLYDYTTRADTRNALHALAPAFSMCFVESRAKATSTVIKRLHSDGLLTRIIHRETSNRKRAFPVWVLSRVTELDTELISTLAMDLSSVKDIGDVGSCIKIVLERNASAARELCEKLNLDTVAAALCKVQHLSAAGWCMEAVFQANPEVGRKLWAAVDRAALVLRANTTKDLWDAGRFVTHVFRGDATAGSDLWARMNRSALATRIGVSDSLQDALRCIAEVSDANAEWGRELWSRVDGATLTARIGAAPNTQDLGRHIHSVCQANRVAGRELYSLLDLPAVAARLSADENVTNVYWWIEGAASVDMELARELCRDLELVAC